MGSSGGLAEQPKPDSHLVPMTVFLQICDGRPQPTTSQVRPKSDSKKDRFAIEALHWIGAEIVMNGPDLVGLTGVAAYLSAYGLLQLGTLKVEDSRYALLNALGALLILYSLLFDFNLASFVTQSAWLLLTAIGYIRSHIKRSRAVRS